MLRTGRRRRGTRARRLFARIGKIGRRDAARLVAVRRPARLPQIGLGVAVLAVGLAVDASPTRWQPARIAVGDGGQTRGADGAPNCRVAQVIDAERFLALFLDRLCPASS